MVTVDGPPDPALTRRLSSSDCLVICSEPSLHQPAGPDRGWLWVGRGWGPGPDQSQVDTWGPVRLAKLLSRLIFDPAWKPQSPWDRPLEGMVEIVRACKLKCPLCPVGNGEAKHYPNMTVEVFSRIAAALAPTVWKLSLYNYGEPLLHPHLGRLIRIAKDEGLERVEIVTNGNVMRPGLAREMVLSGLDFLRFSIDGATQATYAQYRAGGDLGRVWSNLRAVRQARQTLDAENPTLEAQFIVTRINEHQIEDFKKAASANGADQVRLKTFNVHMSGAKFAQQGRTFLPQDMSLSRYRDYGQLTLGDAFKLSRCRWPWDRVVVNADGTVVPCCYDYNGRHPLGSFTSEGSHWWQTEARRAFGRRLKEDPLSIEMCARCPVGVPDLSVKEDGVMETKRAD
ncbi:MAG: radical SAM protein [Deltaproteobacteria bacterium]|nr:radical SAM protein [Deltaproteobacteria bacterium]